MMQSGNTTWWIHGSAPGGEKFFHTLVNVWHDKRREGDFKTITCNAGIIEFLCHHHRSLVPHFYWLQDPVAVELYGRFAHVAGRMGTLILSGAHLNDFYVDVHVKSLVKPVDDPPKYIRGWQQHVTLSGLLCLQWIANLAVKGDTIIMTGMTGYTSTPDQIERDTFDGRLGKAGSHQHTTQRIAPFTRSVCETLPEVKFVFCGKPHRVFGPPGSQPQNVRLAQDARELLNVL